MSVQLTSEQVWQEIEKNLFAVIGMVTSQEEARTVGVVYVAHAGKLYIGTQKAAWKVKHIAQNPHVSLTVPIAKRIPLLPWIKIPAATITFSGEAKVLEQSEVNAEILQKLYHDVVKDEKAMAESCVIEVTPQGDFITYGVGIPLMQMRFPNKARGRAAVAATL
ncbi:MAG: pyridoxamine 5'-phosphate oxidase family protein [Caldilineaceae bacterium]